MAWKQTDNNSPVQFGGLETDRQQLTWTVWWVVYRQTTTHLNSLVGCLQTDNHSPEQFGGLLTDRQQLTWTACCVVYRHTTAHLNSLVGCLQTDNNLPEQFGGLFTDRQPLTWTPNPPKLSSTIELILLVLLKLTCGGKSCNEDFSFYLYSLVDWLQTDYHLVHIM